MERRQQSGKRLATRRAIIVGGKSMSYPTPASQAISAAMSGNSIKRDTRPELAIRRALYKAGLRYRIDKVVVERGVRTRPDIVFSRHRLVLFVDGCFWHGCPMHGMKPRSNVEYWTQKLRTNRTRDQRQRRALELGGWKVIRVWEHEEPASVAARVLRAIRQKGAKPTVGK